MMRSSIVAIQMISVTVLLVLVVFVSGCAVHYFDPKTGAEHIWGFGHMVMKASSTKERHQALIRGTDVAGLALGKSDAGGYLVVGWEQRRRVEIIDENTSVRLEWPQANFLNLRVGSDWPHYVDESNPKRGGN
jgi:hypothetical protein